VAPNFGAGAARGEHRGWRAGRNAEAEKRDRFRARLRTNGWLVACDCGRHESLIGAYLPWVDREVKRWRLEVTRMETCKRITLGADPELVLTKGDRFYVAPPGYVDGDQRTGELRPAPAETVPVFVENVRSALFKVACLLPSDVRGHAGAWTAEHPTGGHIHLHHPGVRRQRVLDAVSSVCKTWRLDVARALEMRAARGYGNPGDWRDVPWRCDACACTSFSTEIREPASWLHEPVFARHFLSAMLRAIFSAADADRLEADRDPQPPKRPPAKGDLFRHWGIHAVGRSECGTVPLAHLLNAAWPTTLPAPPTRLVVRVAAGLEAPQFSGLLAACGPVRKGTEKSGSAVVYLPPDLATAAIARAGTDRTRVQEIVYPAVKVYADTRRTKTRKEA
jgi:hypothetical protein